MVRKARFYSLEEKGRMWVRIVFTSSVSLFIVISLCDASYGFRCDGKIVSVGDTKFDVIAKCGDPSFVDTWVENRIQRDHYRELFPKNGRDPRGELERRDYREPLFIEEYVVIEEWTYNLGSNRFIRYLTFENGRLVRIRTGRYGY